MFFSRWKQKHKMVFDPVMGNVESKHVQSGANTFGDSEGGGEVVKEEIPLARK
jgi:hypothetical protein